MPPLRETGSRHRSRLDILIQLHIKIEDAESLSDASKLIA